MTPQIASLMAQYNRWMNERMYEAAATLDAEALSADKGAFFGSILGTLNHIAVGDTIWLHRFAQHEAHKRGRIHFSEQLVGWDLHSGIAKLYPAPYLPLISSLLTGCS